MTLINRIDQLRATVVSLAHDLIGTPEVDKQVQIAFERLVFEMDRLADRCENLGGATKAE